MRIVDYLDSDDGDDVGDHRETADTQGPIRNSTANSVKTPLRKLISRLIPFTWKCGGGRVTIRPEHGETEERQVEEGDDEERLQKEGDSDGTRARICDGCRVRISPNQNLTPGCHELELNFNLVAGLGLLSLVAVNKMELQKTVELRRQMETFFQNLKEECQGKTNVSEPSESETIRLNDRSPELGTTASEITLACDRFSKSDDTDPKEELTEGNGMDQFENLEEELESELELLQLHLQADESSQHQWQIIESGGSELVYNQHEDEIEQCGVNPYELEWRLHELLEARQEERIRELESALKQTKQMIQEPGIEASWLKDATMIISKHIPESSSVSRFL